MDNTERNREPCPLKSKSSKPTNDYSNITYEKCIACQDKGIHCDGPNLLTLPLPELREWVRRWKDEMGLTNEQLSATSGVPTATITRFLSGSDKGCQYDTVYDIVHTVIFYGVPSDSRIPGNPCPASSSEISRTLSEWEQRLQFKQAECDRLVEENIEQQRAYIASRESDRRSIEFLRTLADKRQEDIDEKNRVMNLRRVEVAGLNDTISALQSQRVDDMRDADARYDALREEYRLYRRHNRLRFSLLSVVMFIVGIGFLFYLIWDILHPYAGLFVY